MIAIMAGFLLRHYPSVVNLRGKGKMNGPPKHRSPPCVLTTLAILLVCWLVGFIHAQEPSTQTPPQDARPAEGSGAKPQSQESQAKGGTTGSAAGRGQGFD